MSFNARRKQPPRGGNNSNYGGGGRRPQPRNQTEKSVLNNGIYTNERFMHTATSLIGCVMQMKVKNSRIYEGIFKTFSQHMDVVLEKVHLVEGSFPPSRENIISQMIFAQKDIVQMHVANVDTEFAVIGDNFTDSAISRFNGQVREKELQPWDGTSEECLESDAGGGLEDSLDANANGWDANLMFETNESKFNIKSKYDPTLKDYTTELHKADTEEYRVREAMAERQAKEIEGTSTYVEQNDRENGDEEMAFSAVHRTTTTTGGGGGEGGGGQDSRTGNGLQGVGGGKYVAPHLRHNSSSPSSVNQQQQQRNMSPASRPQQLMVAPSQSSSDSPRSHQQHPLPPPPPPVAVETVATVSNAPMRTNVANDDTAMKSTSTPSSSTSSESPISKVLTSAPPPPPLNASAATAKMDSNKTFHRAGEMSDLFDFHQNFKLPPHDATDSKQSQQQQVISSASVTVLQQMSSSTPTTTTTVQLLSGESPHHHGYEDKTEYKEDDKEEANKKYVLNPLAKEFNPTPKMNTATPGVLYQRNIPSQTPPAPQGRPSNVPSPTVYLSMGHPGQIGGGSGGPGGPHMLFHSPVVPGPNQQHQPRNNIQGKRASVSVATRPPHDVNPGPQSMTGAPLITPIAGQGQIVMPIYPQPLLRMMPPNNIMLDPNQPQVFFQMASPMTHVPTSALGPNTHHMMPQGITVSGAMHGPPPPQQNNGAQTPQPYGQPPQASIAMPTTAGTPQPPPQQMHMYPGGPGGPIAISHPVSLQHHPSNLTSPIIYQGQIPFAQYAHPGAQMTTYASAGQQHQQQQQQQQNAQQQQQQQQQGQQGGPMAFGPPQGMGQSSHLLMHPSHPAHTQMVLAAQAQGGHIGQFMQMPAPVGMSQAPNIGPHHVSLMYPHHVQQGPQQTYTLGQ